MYSPFYFPLTWHLLLLFKNRTCLYFCVQLNVTRKINYINVTNLIAGINLYYGVYPKITELYFLFLLFNLHSYPLQNTIHTLFSWAFSPQKTVQKNFFWNVLQGPQKMCQNGFRHWFYFGKRKDGRVPGLESGEVERYHSFDLQYKTSELTRLSG